MTTQMVGAILIVTVVYWVAKWELPDLIFYLRRKYFRHDDE